MSDPTDSAIRTTSTGPGTTTCNQAPTIKARDDVDGCGCLECRNIETTTTNRTVLDALVWSVRLFRSYPSILAFAGVIILANRLLETDSINALPMPAVGVFEVITAFAFIILVRAYVGTIVAGELTGEPVTVREGFRRSLARTPALVGVILLILVSVMTIPFFVSTPLILLVGVFSSTPVEMVSFPVVAAVGGIVFAVPFLFLLFKFWFAPEACVIGQYSPLKSLRVSWRITTNYRGKFLLIIVIGIGSAASLYLPTVLPQPGTGLPLVHPVLGVISSSVGELLSVVWASAYAHIYVQGIVS
ncbi:hypothetical protein SAMN05444422_109204 [Halobiforma haloterrestris]|uniref:DUF7847 domain-containing protein n=1 Tax=Natronobacterium haloterrestre TaxID=148448 RepID=A0A1I1JVL5_NATHA|nr:hypothetical protein [Halobiforma haloterrestris]SFC52022.1 hypothetical protein SAMN05444422_109204 [Halobiforma haloterrestris]